METLLIKEYKKFQNQDIFIQQQNVSFSTGTPVQSKFFSNKTTFITITATQHCHISFGTNPRTSTEKGLFIYPNVPITLEVSPLTKLSVIESPSVLSYWQDVDFPIVARTAKVGQPTPVAISTIDGDDIVAPSWAINDYSMCEGSELVHHWKEESPLHWHIHLITNGEEAQDKYVKFQIKWAIAVSGGTLTPQTTITSEELLIPANTADKTHIIYPIGTSDELTGYRIGSQIYPRLQRIAATGTAPSGDPWITMLQAHILCDSLGSRNITSK